MKKKKSHVPSGYEIGLDEDGLTAREREVRDLIGKGLTAGQIAEKIGVTRQRVSQYVATLTAKGVIEKKGGKNVVKKSRKRRG